MSDLLSTAKRFALFPGPQGQTHYFERPFSSSYHIDENWFCRWERKREKEKRSLKRGGAVRRREQRGDGDGWKAEWGGVLLCLVLHTVNKHRPRCFTPSLGFVNNLKIPDCQCHKQTQFRTLLAVRKPRHGPSIGGSKNRRSWVPY